MLRRARRLARPDRRRVPVPTSTSILRILAVAAIALTATITGATPAAAHLDLEATDPPKGAVVSGPVEVVTFTFTQAAELAGTGLQVVDSSGRVLPAEATTPNGGATWQVQPAEPLETGRYGLTWSVVAGDAHPKTGTATFRVAAAPVASASGPADSSADPPAQSPPEGVAAAPATGDAGDEDAMARAMAESIDEAHGMTGPWSWMASFGRWLSYAGVLVGVGALIIARTALVGTREDLVVATWVVRASAVAGVAGASLHGLALVGALGAAVPLGVGSAVVARVVACSVLVASAGLLARPSGGRRQAPAAVGAFGQDRDAADGSGVDGSGSVGAPPRAAGPPGTDLDAPSAADTVRGVLRRPVPAAAAAAVLLLTFLLDGHTATVGPRPVMASADLLHTGAAAVWSGGVVLLAVLLMTRGRSGSPTGAGDLAVRFSVPAGAAALGVGISGAVMAWLILDSFGGLVATAWGRTLLVKLGLVAVVAAMGYVNNQVALPALDGRRPGWVRILRRTVAVEATVMLGVLLVTAVLVASAT